MSRSRLRLLSLALLVAGCGGSERTAQSGGAGEDAASGTRGNTAGSFSGGTAGLSSGGAGGGSSGVANGGTPGNGGASGVPNGGAPQSSAGGPAVSCEWASFDTGSDNEIGIGEACTPVQEREIGACLGNFCISRVLSDRWPSLQTEPGKFGHCTKHCDSTDDCGSGFECCEPRRGAFCLRYNENPLLDSGCSERCATNHLGCGEGEICCERLGKICVSDRCDGVCPT